MTDKDDAIEAVLRKRADSCERGIREKEREINALQKDVEYLSAKREGYMQAIDLLNQPLESIKIEL
jgi:hypothetical protein